MKSVRTFNASDEVNLLIDEQAPKGKGFSAWVNGKILDGHNKQLNKFIEIPEMKNVRVKL